MLLVMTDVMTKDTYRGCSEQDCDKYMLVKIFMLVIIIFIFVFIDYFSHDIW